MAYVQKTIPPPNKVLSFSLKDFSGGLNNVSDQLKPEESPNLLNMSFVDETLMEKRLGQMYYDELNLTDSVTFIDEFRPYTDNDVLIRCSDKAIYFNTTKLTDVVAKVHGINFEGKYFFSDGTDLYVYGKFPQAESTYEKIIGTAINSYILMKVVSPTDGHTMLDTTHVKGITNYDYTSKKIYYEPCENEFKDAYKGANKVPEKVKYFVNHKGRLYLSGSEKDNDNVFLSDVQNPYYYPTALPLQLPPNSDKVVGMHVYDDCVIVGRHDDLYAIMGETNNPLLGIDMFKLKRLNTHTGFASHNAIDIVNNYLFYLGNDGNVYALTSAKYDDKNLITTIISRQIDIEKKPINLSLDEISDACSIYFDEEWYLSIKDKILIYSYKNRTWTMYNNFNATSFYNINNVLIWGNNVGRTVKFTDGEYLDFGLPYQAYWWSKRFDMDESNSFKQFREFFLVAHTYEAYDSDILICFEIDYADVKDILETSNRISVWGKSMWGNRFINRNIIESLPLVLGRRGRNLRFKFYNGYFIRESVATYNDLANVSSKEENIVVKTLDTGNLYLYTDKTWVLLENRDINQRMKIYQINGDYELRGKR